MALGIYKPSQGYWVRVLTAPCLGIITLALAAWGWNQMALLAERLPANHYSMTIDAGDAKVLPAPGEAVTLLLDKPAAEGQDLPVVGSAVVRGYVQENRQLIIQDYKKDAASTVVAPTARVVRTSKGDYAVQTGTFHAEPVVSKGVLQIGFASVVLLLGTVLAYWLCAVRPRSSDFLIATDLEMKKVHWSNWKDIKAQTLVVVFASVLISLFLFGADLMFQAFFRLIDVIRA